jgi:hypothetical protein
VGLELGLGLGFDLHLRLMWILPAVVLNYLYVSYDLSAPNFYILIVSALEIKLELESALELAVRVRIRVRFSLSVRVRVMSRVNSSFMAGASVRIGVKNIQSVA